MPAETGGEDYDFKVLGHTTLRQEVVEHEKAHDDQIEEALKGTYKVTALGIQQLFRREKEILLQPVFREPLMKC